MQGLIDIHCHIVPGVDDGAATLYDAGKILQMEYREGVSAVIVTPHYRKGMFETPQEEIERQYRRLKKIVSSSRSGMRIFLGGECHSAPDLVKELEEGRRPVMAGSRYVLVEFSGNHTYTQIRNQVYELTAAGYRPIIAHAERYPCLLKDMLLAGELVHAGAQIQVTASSVTGGAGRSRKKFCKWLMKNDYLTYIATDAHDITIRRPDLGSCAVYVAKKYGEEYARKIFIKNPREIIKEGISIERRLKNGKNQYADRKTAIRNRRTD